MNLTKIIFNTMKGAPVLASEWGGLLNVIRTVCITGFNEFKNLNSSKTYYVHAIDSNKIYNAVTKDILEPLK